MIKHLNLLCGIALTIFVVSPVLAAEIHDKEKYCTDPELIGKQALDSKTDKRGIGEKFPTSSEYRDLNTDRLMHGHKVKQSCRQAKDGAHRTILPFRVSIDGVPLDDHDALNSADVTRCQDVDLKKADIQVRFDRLEDTQALNVTSFPARIAEGEKVTFTPYSNYAYFIQRAEIHIYDQDQSQQTKPLVILPVDKNIQNSSDWIIPHSDRESAYKYVLRVYDEAGRFDETEPRLINIIASEKAGKKEIAEQDDLAGYGENSLAVKNIPVSGGMITINGSNLPAGSEVKALGANLPVDANGKFAYRQIFPEGKYNIPIAVHYPDGSGKELSRAVYLPEQDWFYIGLADVTIGKNNVSGPARLVTGDSSERYKGKLYAEGRLAYYVKGKMNQGWELTSSADTKEQPLEDLFSNFTQKDPRYLLKRLDSNKYYQVYGDDSTTVEDARTQGKFYVKLEKDDSHVMWGNFQTKITGTDLLNYSRTLYGANGEYKSPELTQFGERKTDANLFAADPGSVSSLDELRGTGGSLYYLRGQDVVVGSERIRVEVRDRDSGIVLSSQYLTYGQDYEINYMQGRIILREALESTSSASTLVRTGNLSGNPVFLVASYEYTPGVTDLGNLTKGGRVSHWFGDYLKLGGSLYDQKGSGINQVLSGVDATLRYAPGTYLKLEQAHSSGTGNGEQSSVNGGFDFDTVSQTSSSGVDANAYRIELASDLKELKESWSGKIGAYSLLREDGYSAPGQVTSENVTQHGLTAEMPLNETSVLNGKFDFRSGRETGNVSSGELGLSNQLSKEKQISVALRHDNRTSSLYGGNSASLSNKGARTDAALKYLYTPFDNEEKKKSYEIYGLAQGTLHKTSERDRNNRIGFGGSVDITDRLSLNGEATHGNQGLGFVTGLEFQKSDSTNYYINYQLDNERTDIGLRGKNSALVVGGKTRYSDSLSVFSENRRQVFENDASSLIHSFGLDFATGQNWTWGARLEEGTITDKAAGDTDRLAASLSSHYNNKKVKYGGTIEFRDEKNDLSGKRDSFLMSNNLAYQTTPDWRMLVDLDFALSHSGLSNSLNANFVEFGMGYAYRPIDNDRLNALFRYEYLSDLAPEDQLNATRTSSASDYEQRSHVLSADIIYDLTSKLAIGGKVGYRLSEIRDKTVQDSEFFDSNALLLVGRVDYHVVKDWELTGELRRLSVSAAKDDKTGALLGVYKHMNQNMKLGVGYNFTDFSDDLTDLDYNSKGVFFNIIGKF
ncbi:MAG: OmpA family protein [Alphaproteobacteria bacterium]|nr:OmpA family protein [Alphaproteobacteria bacterium]